MTYGEVLKLPDNTRVFLKEGRVGRIVSWHHTAEAVAVEVASERRIIRAQDLRIGPDGTVSEFPQDPAADPRANAGRHALWNMLSAGCYLRPSWDGPCSVS